MLLIQGLPSERILLSYDKAIPESVKAINGTCHRFVYLLTYSLSVPVGHDYNKNNLYFFHIFNVLSTPIAVWTIFVQSVKIVKKFCVVSYIVADTNKLISRNVYNDIHILRG